MVIGNNGIEDYKKCRQIDDNFDPHATGAIWRDAHCPMELLEPSRMGTYVKYPYRKFHIVRALSLSPV
jgi:hypothetical protein